MSNVTAMVLDLSLSNPELYRGCTIETINGRCNLVTAPESASAVVGTNVANFINGCTREQRKGAIVLTGPMAIWSYLVVFHAVVHAFREVYYDDGRNQPVLVARHG